MSDEPLYKATLTKSLLVTVRELPVADREAVLEKVGADNVARIDDAAKTDWLPASVQAQMDSAIGEVLGAERLLDLIRKYTREAADIPVFAPIARGAMNLFGGGPAGGLRILPRTWGFVARNCGHCKVEMGEGRARVSYVDLPEVMRTPAFGTASEGGLLGLMDFVKARNPVVKPMLDDLAHGEVHYEVSWDA